uniref:Multidrug and toxin extrusion protein n=1 Tax=Schmidtea mediterranea TaxID=79327 RepID=A0A0H3YFP0_SCHMD|nr:slc47a-5 [Schmidtea mediterranea]
MIIGLKEKLLKSEYPKLCRALIILFGPLFPTTFLQFLINVTPIMFVGQLDKIQLDGVAFGVSVIHIFGTSVGYGLTYACDTLFSQAYGSADKKKTGFYLQKSLCISLLFPFPVAAVLLNVDHLLLLFGQDPRICEISSIYISTYLPAFPVQYFYFILSRYLQNQDKTWPPLVAVLLGNIFNFTAQYLCLYKFNFTYQSSAICMIITYLIMAIFNLTYLITSKFYKPTWPGWTISALYNWDDFLRLAIPGIAYATFEQINWEAEIFMAGIMGIVPMAVHSVLSQTGTVTCPLYVAIGICANVKIGQYLGAGQHERAKKIAQISIVAVVVLSLTIGSIISIIREYWPLIFTTDKIVNEQVSKLIAFYPIYFVPESVNGVLSGIMRGCAKHSLTMYLAFGCMYLMGLPVAAMLGFLAQLQVFGLWIGNTVGLSTLMIGYVISVWFFNWETLALDAAHRLTRGQYEDQNEIFEKNPLLITKPKENEKVNYPNGPYQLKHNRLPSQGITSSYDLIRTKKIIVFENLRLKSKLNKNHKSIIIKRSVTLFVCLLMLFIGIIGRLSIRPDYNRYKAFVTDSKFNSTTESMFVK